MIAARYRGGTETRWQVGRGDRNRVTRRTRRCAPTPQQHGRIHARIPRRDVARLPPNREWTRHNQERRRGESPEPLVRIGRRPRTVPPPKKANGQHRTRHRKARQRNVEFGAPGRALVRGGRPVRLPRSARHDIVLLHGPRIRSQVASALFGVRGQSGVTAASHRGGIDTATIPLVNSVNGPSLRDRLDGHLVSEVAHPSCLVHEADAGEEREARDGSAFPVAEEGEHDLHLVAGFDVRQR